MESKGSGLRNMRREGRKGPVDFGGEGLERSFRVLRPVNGKKMVVDQVYEDWSKAAVRRRDSADALADDRMAVGEGIDAVVTFDASLNFGREMAEFVGAKEIWKNVAETEFGRGFGEVDVREPIHSIWDRRLGIAVLEARHEQLALEGQLLRHG